MKRYLLLSILGLLAFSVRNLSASQIQCPTTNSTFDQLLAFNSEANGCYSQDKLFWGFTYPPTGTDGAASTVNAQLIFTSLASGDIHGWNFGSNDWSDPYTIGYTIEVCPPTSACAGNVAAGTEIRATDAAYAPTFGTVGTETVTYTGGYTNTFVLTPGNAYEGAAFGFYTLGPITVMGQFAGDGDVTQTTLRFYEGSVPEPMTLLLVGGGLLGVGLLSSKRRDRK